jgi:hypothetical protein
VLIDDRIPPPFSPHERPAWEPDWRLCGWFALAIAASVAGALTGGAVSFVLLCAAVAFWARALTQALPYGDGLREHRQ